MQTKELRCIVEINCKQNSHRSADSVDVLKEVSTIGSNLESSPVSFEVCRRSACLGVGLKGREELTFPSEEFSVVSDTPLLLYCTDIVDDCTEHIESSIRGVLAAAIRRNV